MGEIQKRADDQFAKIAEQKRWRISDAKIVMEVWLASGLSLAEFARQHDIGHWRMRDWKRKMEIRSDGVRRAKTVPRFVSLKVTNMATSSAGFEDQKLEVVLHNGLRILIGQDFEENNLIRLVTALEQATC